MIFQFHNMNLCIDGCNYVTNVSLQIIYFVSSELQLPTFLVPAMVNFTVARKTITENDSTTIECKAHGNPPAVATLKGPKNENISLVNGVANLTRVKRANSGVYTCTANNNVGSSASKAETITVQCK